MIVLPPGPETWWQHSFRMQSRQLKASNGQVVASGEAYETKAAARNGCESVQRAADGAPIEETAS